jgi:hypothetical protein
MASAISGPFHSPGTWNRKRRRVELHRDDWTPTGARISWDSAPPERDVVVSHRRAGIARAVGILGILGCVGLAVYAFGTRGSAALGSYAVSMDRVELPWDPKLEPGPAPVELERIRPAFPISAAGLPVVPAPEFTDTASAPAAPPLEEGSAADAVAAEMPAADVAAQAPPPETPAVPKSAESAVETETKASKAQAEARASEASAVERSAAEPDRSESEPALTPEEIRNREERYEAWLKENGLERIR